MVFQISQIMTGNPLTDALIVALASDDQMGYVYQKVAKTVRKKKKKGTLPILGHSNKVKNEAPRADDQPANETLKLGVYQIPFECHSKDERVLFTTTEENDSDNVDGLLLKQGVVIALAKLIKLKCEKEFARLATTVTNYPSGFYDNSIAAEDKFDYVSDDDIPLYSKPIKFLLDKADIARRKFGGIYPDSLMFTTSSWNTFFTNANVEIKLPTTRYQTVLEGDAIPLLRTGPLKYLKQIIIAGGIEDTNIDSDTENNEDIYADDVIIYKDANVQDNGGQESGLVEAGAFLNVETNNPVHYGSMEYEPANKEKGKWIENRYANNMIMVKNNNGTVSYAYLLKGTNT